LDAAWNDPPAPYDKGVYRFRVRQEHPKLGSKMVYIGRAGSHGEKETPGICSRVASFITAAMGFWTLHSGGERFYKEATDGSGTGHNPTALPNNGDGIDVTGNSTNTTIGGTTAGVGNTISGNNGNGVKIDTATIATVTVIQGNTIGLVTNTSNSTTAVPNTGDGVQVFALVTVGGTATGAGNVLSGNTGNGVLVSGSGANGTVIQGNYIGTNNGATLKFGNGADGIKVTGANNVTIGVAAGSLSKSNIIAGNALFGIQVSNSSGDFIGNNAVGNNGSLTAIPNQVGVEIDGSTGVTIGAGGGYNNIISGNSGDGILLAGDNQTLIQGNLIGLNAQGASALANGGDGIDITGTTTTTTIGGTYRDTGPNPFTGNYISGNVKNGIEFASQATGLTVLGNVIGLGTLFSGSKQPNRIGVLLFGGQATVGGTGPGQGNFISGNTTYGIEVNGSTTVQTIVGNVIGTHNFEGGRAGVGNGSDGVLVFAATGTVVGGTGTGQANVISGNGGAGVHVQQSKNTAVQGNLIGTNLAGTTKLANSGDGVLIDGSAFTTVISNLISGNHGNGVNLISASNNNTIQSNKIGTTANGVANLGNTGFGVFVQGASQQNTIGNILAGSGNGNIIAFNAKGVVIGSSLIDNSTQNSILGNSIFSNTVLGIDLGNNGVTPNHNPPSTTGPNLLQNFPVLTSAVINGSEVTIQGTLSSFVNQTFQVEFFLQDAAGPTGHGEGKTLIGFQNVTIDATGKGTINVTLAVTVKPGQVISATATSPTGNTSEFSLSIKAKK